MSLRWNTYNSYKLAIIVWSTLLSITFKLVIIIWKCDFNAVATLLVLQMIWHILNQFIILLGPVALLLGLYVMEMK